MICSLPGLLILAGTFLFSACDRLSFIQPTPSPTPRSKPTLTATSTSSIKFTPTTTFTPTSTATVTATSTRTVTAAPTSTVTPEETEKVVNCPGAPDTLLKPGDWAMVSVDQPLPNRIRSQPGGNGEIIGLIQPGDAVLIEDGPHCADDFVWWYVFSLDGLEGWTAEGDTEAYWLVPLQSVSSDLSSLPNPITLTANQVKGASDIEKAINRATAEGTRPGTVILDGQGGTFVFTDIDQSINMFVSNLNLIGVNRAKIEYCAGALYFDNFPLKNILIEGIEFNCTGSGIEAGGAFKNVTIRNNIFRAEAIGIGVGGNSSDWLITGNLIETGGNGINLSGVRNILIANNHISGSNGISLRKCNGITVRKNIIQASDNGVLLLEESWVNTVQLNIIEGVSQSGIKLEAGVSGNQILDNKISCAPGKSCITVDATPDVAQRNTIAGNSQ